MIVTFVDEAVPRPYNKNTKTFVAHYKLSLSFGMRVYLENAATYFAGYRNIFK